MDRKGKDQRKEGKGRDMEISVGKIKCCKEKREDEEQKWEGKEEEEKNRENE